MKTYSALLAETKKRKTEILTKYITDYAFRMFADADKNKLAAFLYKPFLEELTDHIDEYMENAYDEAEEREIFSIYSSYYDGDLDYDMLPDEARIDV